MFNKELFVSFIPVIFLSFVFSLIISKIVIPILKGHKIGQSIRAEGPESHKGKAGTPTMGGICFIMAMLIALAIMSLVFVFIGRQAELIPLAFTLILALANGLIGFIDDYAKLIKKQNEGLTIKAKLILLTLVAVLYVAALEIFTELSTAIRIPFTDVSIELGFGFYIFAVVLIVGMANATNFTDGLDGLASSVTIIVMLFFAAVGLTVFKSAALTLLSGAMMGVLFGFLVFNSHPADVFMGDTGSLFIGGIVTGAAFMIGQPLIIVIAGGVYIIELLSVAIQIGVFKATKRRPKGPKRVFRMAPIHHHFELKKEGKGWSEKKIVTVFSIVAFLFCVAAWFGVQ